MVHATFVPGAAGQGSFWLPIIERLPASWQAQSIDLPGLGTGPSLPDVSSYGDLVDLAASMPAPSVVVAQSMGGFIALELALEYPELVTHLVLVAVTGGIDMSVHGAANWRTEYAASFPTAQPWAREPVPDLSHRLQFEVRHVVRSLGVGLVQPGQSLVAVTQPGMDQGDRVR